MSWQYFPYQEHAFHQGWEDPWMPYAQQSQYDDYSAPPTSTSYLEDMLCKFAESQIAFQETTEARFARLENNMDTYFDDLARQMGEIATVVQRLETDLGNPNSSFSQDQSSTPTSPTSKVCPKLVNSNLDIKLFAPFPSRLAKELKDDGEEDIKLEFDELEEEESYLTREEDIDSDEEAAPLENCMTIGENVFQESKPSVGEDESDLESKETTLVANGMVENNLMMDLVPHEDPDFLGVKALHQKFEKWVIRHQFIVTLYTCTPRTTFPSNYQWNNANLVCYTLLHKSITATTMALSTLAYHDILKHALSCFLLLSPCILMLLCSYIFAFTSYLLFALRWQDPP